MFVAVLKIDNNRISKYKEFTREVDAVAHVAKFLEDCPEGFVTGGDDNKINIHKFFMEDGVVSEKERKKDQDRALRRLKTSALEAELEKRNTELLANGTTDEAVAYRAELAK